MIAFIDDHREAHGAEPTCKLLPIAPSTYRAHAALCEKIRRMFDENFRVYGLRKAWRQVNRDG